MDLTNGQSPTFEETTNYVDENGSHVKRRKRKSLGRRVSFADETLIRMHIFPRDEEYESPTPPTPAQNGIYSSPKRRSPRFAARVVDDDKENRVTNLAQRGRRRGASKPLAHGESSPLQPWRFLQERESPARRPDIWLDERDLSSHIGDDENSGPVDLRHLSFNDDESSGDQEDRTLDSTTFALKFNLQQLSRMAPATDEPFIIQTDENCPPDAIVQFDQLDPRCSAVSAAEIPLYDSPVDNEMCLTEIGIPLIRKPVIETIAGPVVDNNSEMSFTVQLSKAQRQLDLESEDEEPIISKLETIVPTSRPSFTGGSNRNSVPTILSQQVQNSPVKVIRPEDILAQLKEKFGIVSDDENDDTKVREEKFGIVSDDENDDTKVREGNLEITGTDDMSVCSSSTVDLTDHTDRSMTREMLLLKDLVGRDGLEDPDEEVRMVGVAVDAAHRGTGKLTSPMEADMMLVEEDFAGAHRRPMDMGFSAIDEHFRDLQSAKEVLNRTEDARVRMIAAGLKDPQRAPEIVNSTEDEDTMLTEEDTGQESLPKEADARASDVGFREVERERERDTLNPAEKVYLLLTEAELTRLNNLAKKADVTGNDTVFREVRTAREMLNPTVDAHMMFTEADLTGTDRTKGHVNVRTLDVGSREVQTTRETFKPTGDANIMLKEAESKGIDSRKVGVDGRETDAGAREVQKGSETINPIEGTDMTSKEAQFERADSPTKGAAVRETDMGSREVQRGRETHNLTEDAYAMVQAVSTRTESPLKDASLRAAGVVSGELQKGRELLTLAEGADKTLKEAEFTGLDSPRKNADVRATFNSQELRTSRESLRLAEDAAVTESPKTNAMAVSVRLTELQKARESLSLAGDEDMNLEQAEFTGVDSLQKDADVRATLNSQDLQRPRQSLSMAEDAAMMLEGDEFTGIDSPPKDEAMLLKEAKFTGMDSPPEDGDLSAAVSSQGLQRSRLSLAEDAAKMLEEAEFTGTDSPPKDVAMMLKETKSTATNSPPKDADLKATVRSQVLQRSRLSLAEDAAVMLQEAEFTGTDSPPKDAVAEFKGTESPSNDIDVGGAVRSQDSQRARESLGLAEDASVKSQEAELRGTDSRSKNAAMMLKEAKFTETDRSPKDIDVRAAAGGSRELQKPRESVSLGEDVEMVLKEAEVFRVDIPQKEADVKVTVSSQELHRSSEPLSVAEDAAVMLKETEFAGTDSPPEDAAVRAASVGWRKSHKARESLSLAEDAGMMLNEAELSGVDTPPKDTYARATVSSQKLHRPRESPSLASESQTKNAYLRATPVGLKDLQEATTALHNSTKALRKLAKDLHLSEEARKILKWTEMDSPSKDEDVSVPNVRPRDSQGPSNETSPQPSTEMNSPMEMTPLQRSGKFTEEQKATHILPEKGEMRLTDVKLEPGIRMDIAVDFTSVMQSTEKTLIVQAELDLKEAQKPEQMNSISEEEAEMSLTEGEMQMTETNRESVAAATNSSPKTGSTMITDVMISTRMSGAQKMHIASTFETYTEMKTMEESPRKLHATVVGNTAVVTTVALQCGQEPQWHCSKRMPVFPFKDPQKADETHSPAIARSEALQWAQESERQPEVAIEKMAVSPFKEPQKPEKIQSLSTSNGEALQSAQESQFQPQVANNKRMTVSPFKELQQADKEHSPAPSNSEKPSRPNFDNRSIKRIKSDGKDSDNLTSSEENCYVAVDEVWMQTEENQLSPILEGITAQVPRVSDLLAADMKDSTPARPLLRSMWMTPPSKVRAARACDESETEGEDGDLRMSMEIVDPTNSWRYSSIHSSKQISDRDSFATREVKTLPPASHSKQSTPARPLLKSMWMTPPSKVLSARKACEESENSDSEREDGENAPSPSPSELSLGIVDHTAIRHSSVDPGERAKVISEGQVPANFASSKVEDGLLLTVGNGAGPTTLKNKTMARIHSPKIVQEKENVGNLSSMTQSTAAGLSTIAKETKGEKTGSKQDNPATRGFRASAEILTTVAHHKALDPDALSNQRQNVILQRTRSLENHQQQDGLGAIDMKPIQIHSSAQLIENEKGTGSCWKESISPQLIKSESFEHDDTLKQRIQSQLTKSQEKGFEHDNNPFRRHNKDPAGYLQALKAFKEEGSSPRPTTPPPLQKAIEVDKIKELSIFEKLGIKQEPADDIKPALIKDKIRESGGESVKVAKLSVWEFLILAEIPCPLDRRSDLLQYAGSRNSFDEPHHVRSLSDAFTFACIVAPQIKVIRNACEDLYEEVDLTAASVAQLVDRLTATNPAIFSYFQNAPGWRKKEISEQLQRFKGSYRLQAEKKSVFLQAKQESAFCDRLQEMKSTLMCYMEIVLEAKNVFAGELLRLQANVSSRGAKKECDSKAVPSVHVTNFQLERIEYLKDKLGSLESKWKLKLDKLRSRAQAAEETSRGLQQKVKSGTSILSDLRSSLVDKLCSGKKTLRKEDVALRPFYYILELRDTVHLLHEVQEGFTVKSGGTENQDPVVELRYRSLLTRRYVVRKLGSSVKVLRSSWAAENESIEEMFPQVNAPLLVSVALTARNHGGATHTSETNSGARTQSRLGRLSATEAASSAFPSVKNGGVEDLVTNLRASMQVTRFLLGNLMDLLDEVRKCQPVVNAHCGDGVCGEPRFRTAPDDGQLQLELKFIDCISWIKFSVILDMNYLSRTGYPLGEVPAKVETEFCHSKVRHLFKSETLEAELNDLKPGYHRLTRTFAVVGAFLGSLRKGATQP